MPSGFIEDWLEVDQDSEFPNVALLTERAGAREGALLALCAIVADHLVGADVLSRMGFVRAAQVVRANLPTEKRIQSGDLAEVIGTEYVLERTDFSVPIKRLRYKDHRNMSMRGDDIIGLRRDGTGAKFLKGEVKSRSALTSAVLDEARDALRSNGGRPKPETIAFIARVLRREGRDDEAESFEDLQLNQLRLDDVAHLVFTMSGNPPSTMLRALAQHSDRRDLRLVGLLVTDHQAFIQTVFGRLSLPAEAPIPLTSGDNVQSDGTSGAAVSTISEESGGADH